MIPVARFVVESTDEPAWLAARATGVTATQVAKAMTVSGMAGVVSEMVSPPPTPGNAYMAFGRESEPWLAMWVKDRYEVMPNRWLIAGERATDLATPDGLSLDHTEISEIKTGGTEAPKPSRVHRDQIQWQLHVTGASRCRYTFMLRTPNFQPAWLEPVGCWIDRDENRIAQLKVKADQLMEIKHGL